MRFSSIPRFFEQNTIKRTRRRDKKNVRDTTTRKRDFAHKNVVFHVERKTN